MHSYKYVPFKKEDKSVIAENNTSLYVLTMTDRVKRLFA
mgnify:FL=1